MKKIGIIDVGGGTRGIYGAGVFDYLIDHKIEIPYVIGISAGGANVASYIAKQKGRNYVFYTEYFFEKEYMSVRNFVKNRSYVNLDYVYSTLSNSNGKYPLDYDTFAKSKQEVYVVATNAFTAEDEYFGKKDVSRDNYTAFCGSACIPIISKPYEFRGKYYFDGSISNPIPYEKCFEAGCEKVIVILTRPRTYQKNDDKKKWLYKTIQKKYPKFVEKLRDRDILYNRKLKEILKLEKEGKILIVDPKDTTGMGTLTKDKEKLKKLYEMGYEDAKKIENFIK